MQSYLKNKYLTKLTILMTTKNSYKKQLIEDVNIACHKMSTASIIFHQSLAERAGISGVDHKYLDILLQKGTMTAGHLAKLAGLTTGAITGIVDRLEKQGLVKREKDPKDRRKILLVPQKEETMKMFTPLLTDFIKDNELLHNKYNTKNLQFIKKYLDNITRFVTDQTHKLNKKP